jgi:hypothetical protein
LLNVFFFQLLVYYSDWFFPLFSLGGGQSVQWAVVIYHVLLSSLGGVEALLVSPFIVEWGCYAWAGGVEESEFCLFLVVFPARCISRVSPRF